MNNQTNNLPVCTFCKEPMEEGYIWLAAQNAELRWQIEKPSLSAWRFWSMSQGEKLLQGVRSKKRAKAKLGRARPKK
jgi:hypothetical protein